MDNSERVKGSDFIILTDNAGHVWGVILCGHIRQGTSHGWWNIQWCPSILVSMSTIIQQVRHTGFSEISFGVTGSVNQVLIIIYVCMSQLPAI